jgi:hypothetical protein
MRDKSVLFLFHFPEKEFGKSGRIVTKLSAYRKKLLSRCVPVVQLKGDVNFSAVQYSTCSSNATAYLNSVALCPIRARILR